MTILLDCYQNQGRVFTMGNGGSASAAQHFASDLSKYVISHHGVPFDARCLTDNVALYTAWANDAPRQDVFVNQVRGLLKPGDAVIAVSVHGGSGFSADLVNGVRYANRMGARTISIVGFDGGLLKNGIDLRDPRARRVHAPDRRHASRDPARDLAPDPRGIGRPPFVVRP